jgi:hypothetical protein
MECLDLVRELPELGVEMGEVRVARSVGAEQRAVGLPDSPGVEVGRGGAGDQRRGGPRVTRAELEGRLAAVAPAPDDRAWKVERRDQLCDVVGDPRI